MRMIERVQWVCSYSTPMHDCSVACANVTGQIVWHLPIHWEQIALTSVTPSAPLHSPKCDCGKVIRQAARKAQPTARELVPQRYMPYDYGSICVWCLWKQNGIRIFQLRRNSSNCTLMDTAPMSFPWSDYWIPYSYLPSRSRDTAYIFKISLIFLK